MALGVELYTPTHYIADMVKKKRQSKKNRNGTSILTEKDIFIIRAKYVYGEKSMKKLGEIYGVSAAQISNIVNYRSWK